MQEFSVDAELETLLTCWYLHCQNYCMYICSDADCPMSNSSELL